MHHVFTFKLGFHTAQSDLELMSGIFDPPASPQQVLGLSVCAAMAQTSFGHARQALYQLS